MKTQFCIQVRFSTRRSGPTRGPQKRPVHYKDDNYNNNDKRYSFKNHSKCKQITESTPRNHFQMIKTLTAHQNAFSFKEREHLKQLMTELQHVFTINRTLLYAGVDTDIVIITVIVIVIGLGVNGL